MVTIFYPDLSQYDSAVTVEPGTVIVGARATLSASVADTQYERFKLETGQVGGFFFAYHWLNHGNVAAQALWAYRHVGSVPLMLDVEDEPGNTGYAGPVTVQDVLSFVDAYRKLGGVCHLAYLPEWYWSGHMGSPDLTPLAVAGLHLISSNYTAYSDSGSGWKPYGGLTPVAWQYTDVLMYGGGLCDFNAFRGTVEQFIELATGDNIMTNPMAFRDKADIARLVLTGATFSEGYGTAQGPEYAEFATIPMQQQLKAVVDAVQQLQSTLDAVLSALHVLSVSHAGTLHVSGDVTVTE